MKVHSNLILIGGSSQNVGKTTFTIDILKKYSSTNSIIAIKTSCHFHGILDTDIVIENNSEFTITEETVTNTGKDSSRMLKAGASRVFFIQAKDEFIGNAFSYISEKLGNDDLIICETASLRKHLVPEFFIALVNDKNEELSENKIILRKADIMIEGYLNNKENIGSTVEIINNKWILKKQ